MSINTPTDHFNQNLIILIIKTVCAKKFELPLKDF